MVHFMEDPIQVDDDWGYPYELGNHQISNGKQQKQLHNNCCIHCIVLASNLFFEIAFSMGIVFAHRNT